jgi:hypothetical protein
LARIPIRFYHLHHHQPKFSHARSTSMQRISRLTLSSNKLSVFFLVLVGFSHQNASDRATQRYQQISPTASTQPMGLAPTQALAGYHQSIGYNAQYKKCCSLSAFPSRSSNSASEKVSTQNWHTCIQCSRTTQTAYASPVSDKHGVNKFSHIFRRHQAMQKLMAQLKKAEIAALHGTERSFTDHSLGLCQEYPAPCVDAALHRTTTRPSSEHLCASGLTRTKTPQYFTMNFPRLMLRGGCETAAHTEEKISMPAPAEEEISMPAHTEEKISMHASSTITPSSTHMTRSTITLKDSVATHPQDQACNAQDTSNDCGTTYEREHVRDAQDVFCEAMRLAYEKGDMHAAEMTVQMVLREIDEGHLQSLLFMTHVKAMQVCHMHTQRERERERHW